MTPTLTLVPVPVPVLIPVLLQRRFSPLGDRRESGRRQREQGREWEWENWEQSAWGIEGSGDPLPGPKGAPKEMERDFGQGLE